jgi:hypothetical protein
MAGEEQPRRILQKKIERNAAINNDGSKLGCFESA